MMSASLSLRESFSLLSESAPHLARRTARERCQRLRQLKDVLLREEAAIQAAMQADLGKCLVETRLTEILPVVSEIRLVCRRLRGWMAGRAAATPLTLLGHRSRVMVQPKGVVLILSPWNFPFNLTLMPLVSAVAAGNAVVLKPSEHSPHCSALMARMIAEVFPPEEVLLVQGDVATAEALLDLPFNHIFFTGSPAVGKLVMGRAAQHLASVTLELGGKSPAIIDPGADLEKAALRIAWGKFVNAGQICIAPDYVLVDAPRREAFLEALGRAVHRLYGADPAQSPDYTRIIHDRHFQRLDSLLRDAREGGARIVLGGTGDPGQRYFAPTVVTDIPHGSALLQEEIFGPILPVIPYNEPGEALAFIHQRPKPLALYLFAGTRRARRYWMAETRAGGTSINTTLVHFLNADLPFGGDNTSGIGKAHGYYGFMAFSNERAVVREVLSWNAADLLLPPYGKWSERLSALILRWF